MIIDRRVFVAGAALTAITPALRSLPPEAAAPELNVLQPLVFKISGWSAPDVVCPDNQLWVGVGPGWRTAWR